MSPAEEQRFEQLLVFLQQQRGFDFTGYKRPSLMRRVLRRMQTMGSKGFDAYYDHLQVHPEEFGELFNTILINVTSFFRDPHAWEYVEKRVIPEILKAKSSSEPVRVWSAGCAAGQEAYSIAILLAEAMGAEAFRKRVKVYATDADEEALTRARLASYSAKEAGELPDALRERYFEPVNSRFVFRSDLRRSVIFGRHDLVSDAPISRLDLLICRNTLMYFNSETQSRIMARFHFALNGTAPGYLFLGRAEMMLTQAYLFAPLDLKCRIFIKVPLPGARPRPLAKPAETSDAINMPPANERLSELAIDESPLARIVVDANGTVVIMNQKARLLFSLTSKDVGRQLQDLEISYRPTELRSLIEQAYAERRSVTRNNVERRFPDGDTQHLEVVAQPLFDGAQSALGVAITFIDVTRSQRLQDELQSSNEELETTNEELQSTNEELETMNEELQSTNEELQTVNDELRHRTDELNHANAFLQSVLGIVRGAAVVVNRDLNVLVWNERAHDLWGPRAYEVQGKSVLNLDIGLPVGELRAPIRACLQDGVDYREVVLDAVNRRGESMRCRVTCTPLLSSGKRREGVILMMEELAQ